MSRHRRLAYVTLLQAVVHGWLGFIAMLLAYYLMLDGSWLALFPAILCPAAVFCVYVFIMQAGDHLARARQ